MAGDLNRAQLIGRLGGDPEVKVLGNGSRVVNFSLATSDTWRDKNTGDRKESTQWHRVVIWNEQIGKTAEQYLRKGHKCMVEGKIKTRKWTDQSGAEKYTTEIVLEQFDAKLLLLQGRSGDDDGDRSGGGSRSGGAGKRHDDMDDDIPF